MHTKTPLVMYLTEPNAPKLPGDQHNEHMELSLVRHKVTATAKRFRVHCFGQKISMLISRRYVYNLELPVGDTLPKKLMADMNVLYVGSSHRVVRQVYRPFAILLHRGTSNIATRKTKLQT